MPNVEALTLHRFFEIASSLIENAQVDIESKVRLVEEYPPTPFDEYGNEVISYRVLKREPAKMDPKASFRTHRKATYSYDTANPQYPNKILRVESRPIDHVIEFSCWAKTNKIANSRAVWLERLFINSAYVFEIKGAERFYWKDRGPDTYMTTGTQRLFYRPVNFFLRYREFDAKANPVLRKIIIEQITVKPPPK